MISTITKNKKNRYPRKTIIFAFLLFIALIFSLVACSPVLQNALKGSDIERSVMVAEAYRSAPSGAVYAYSYNGITEPNRENYSSITSNSFKNSTDDPLSTLSIDVDTASYVHMRRYLEQSSQFPPKDAIRIEEMINYFSYDYPQPQGDVPFSVTTEISTAPWNKNHQLVHIGIQGKAIDLSEAPASNLVFLIDTSGSMSGDLPLVQQSLNMLVENLREQDTISIVAYAGSAGLVLPATSGYDKQRIKKAINRLQSGGSTAGGAGINLAYKMAKQNFIHSGNNRVIIATDGDFNVGVSSEGELVRLIESKREDHIFLSVLGFGYGNYQDAQMEQLADKGNGNYSYIDGLLEAKKVLVKEMGGTLFAIAKDVKIQVEFNPDKVKSYRLIGYENRSLNKEDFNDDKKDAGELGAGHTVTALYEIIPADSEESTGSVDALKYQQTSVTTTAKSSDEVMTVKLRYKEPTGDTSQLIVMPVLDEQVTFKESSNNFRFSSAVAAFGMLLRDSEFKGDITSEAIQEIARESKGLDREGYRAEFIRLVEIAEIFVSSN
jgi:Ca-activated chloride channel family protein